MFLESGKREGKATELRQRVLRNDRQRAAEERGCRRKKGFGGKVIGSLGAKTLMHWLKREARKLVEAARG